MLVTFVKKKNAAIMNFFLELGMGKVGLEKNPNKLLEERAGGGGGDTLGLKILIFHCPFFPFS